MTYKILIVDDESANLRLLERLFRRDYEVVTASSGPEALELLVQHDVALIITDQRMPGMTGIELLKRTVALRPRMVRIILTGYTDVAALVEAINCGHVYKYVAKPWSNDELRLTVERALEHYEATKSRHELELANSRLAARLKGMTRGVVSAIADALEAKDEYTYAHARRVSGYATAVARRMRLDTELLEEIALAASLHDIGKIGTPDELLLKPGPLTEDERAVVRLHSERGARILGGVPEMAHIAEAVRHHHENFDGTGYPYGLSSEFIPLAARVIRVADAYDAMMSPRPFRCALDHYEAVDRLRAGAGTHFDPAVVEAFCGLRALAEIRRCVAEGYFGSRPSSLPISNRRAPFAELVGIVETDPVLAATILHRANSVVGAMVLTTEIDTACSRLGEEQTRAAAQLVATNTFGEDLQDLRDQSVRCAVAARLMAERSNLLPPEEAYVLGLLHDVGEFLLRALFPAEMENIVWLGDDARADREVVAFGVDHCQVGRWVFESCGLPDHLSAAVQAHHDRGEGGSAAALLLQVADAIARAADASELASHDALGQDRLAALRLTRGDLADIYGRVSEATKSAQVVGVEMSA